MNNLIFLLPLYNDWDSLKKVLDQINDNLKKLNQYGTIIVVNDLSKKSHNNFPLKAVGFIQQQIDFSHHNLAAPHSVFFQKSSFVSTN